MTKKIGLIGLGGQFQSEVLPSILSCKSKFNVVALCDSNTDFLKVISEKFPKAKQYTDYQKLILEEKLDAVVLCLPHFLYFPVSKLALERGIAVFKEKPFALNFHEAQKLASLSKKHKTPVYTVTKRNYYKAYTEAKKMLPKIGKVYQYTARHFMPNGSIYQGWRSLYDKAGGGVFLDMGYHLLDILILYFGKPTHVCMQTSNCGREGYTYQVEDSATLMFEHADGVHGVFQLSCLSGPKIECIEIRGSLGTLIVYKDEVVLFENSSLKDKHNVYYCDGIKATAQALLEFHKADKKTLDSNIQKHLDIMEVVTAAYKERGI